MSVTSFLVPCPCSKCKPKGLSQNLRRIGVGDFVCPESGERVCSNLTEKDRHKRDLARGSKLVYRMKEKRLQP